MKIVWILDSKIESWYEWWIKEMRYYRNAFFLERWIQLVILSIKDFDIKKWVFTRYKSQDWEFAIINDEILPEVVWTRTSVDYERYLIAMEWNTKIFPSKLVVQLANDKRNTYRYLKEYQPETFLLSDIMKDMSLLKEIWETYILKPRTWFWWEWVQKVNKSELVEFDKNNDSEKYILQKVCNFSWWYPWIVKWNHDVRLVFIWWKLSYSTVRTSENDFRVNVSQWWRSDMIDKKNIPDSLLKIAMQCLKRLWWNTTWVVWIDFWFDSDENKRKLIEVNFSPWFVSGQLLVNKHIIDIAYNDYAKYFNNILK